MHNNKKYVKHELYKHYMTKVEGNNVQNIFLCLKVSKSEATK